jgi:cytochrome c553
MAAERTQNKAPENPGPWCELMNEISVFRKAAFVLPLVAAMLASYPAAEPLPTDASQLGAQIVAQGTKNGAVACARCHGFDGAADGSGAFPKLTGQSATYLETELRNYISGDRKNALMQPIAKGLNDAEIKAAAQYYAAVRANPFVPNAQRAELIARGQQLAKDGDPNNNVLACETCHGANGQGNAAIPYLAGQYRQYTALQFQMYRQGLRKSDLMADLARNMREQDVEAVATYYEQVPRSASK